MNKIILGLGDRTLSYKRREGERRVGVPAMPPTCLVRTGQLLQPLPVGTYCAALAHSHCLALGPGCSLHAQPLRRTMPHFTHGPAGAQASPETAWPGQQGPGSTRGVCMLHALERLLGAGLPKPPPPPPSPSLAIAPPLCTCLVPSQPHPGPGHTPCPFLHSCPHLSPASSCNSS